MTYDEYMKNLPNGYITKRKKAYKVFIYSVYVYCVFQLLIKFKLLRIDDQSTLQLVNYGLVFLSITAMLYYYSSRNMYNKIKIINPDEIRIFSVKEKFILYIPIIFSCFFALSNLLFYFLILTAIFLALQKINRPVESIEKYI